MKTTIFKDMLGKEIKVGDTVALSSYHNLGLAIGIVEKIGRVRAQVKPIKCKFNKINSTVESFATNDLIKLQ
jgi:hypothetical protein|tara:strand:+ start:94 stop:309 length:216 start_codon:yes stop_codon:yes gene_type:complete